MKCARCGAENDEQYRFCGACGTPLTIPVPHAAKGSEGFESPEPTQHPATVQAKLLKLNCPSCGGSLELPDNLTVAHCIYCGTKILLDQDGVVRERRDLRRFLELCRVSLEAKNYQEVIDYCNRILEIDPNNVEAWVNKAVSTFWLTTGAHNRFDEAMEYLNRASAISQNNERVANARSELVSGQAHWLNHLGVQEYQHSVDIYKIFFADGYGSKSRAQAESAESAVKAMNYYLAASDLEPSDTTILENIEFVSKDANGIKWGERVRAKLQTLALLRSKQAAQSKLPRLRQELQQAQAELAKLQTQSGLFIGMRMSETKSRIASLQNTIARFERDETYTP